MGRRSGRMARKGGGSNFGLRSGFCFGFAAELLDFGFEGGDFSAERTGSH